MKINGKMYDDKSDMTLAELLAELKYRRDRVAVERNGVIVPKSKFDELIVEKEDVLEVVSFVGGG